MINISQNNFLLKNQNPKAKAIISSLSNLTYQELHNKVLLTAEFLQDQKIKSREKIGIIGQNSVEYVVVVLALWQIAAVPVPINIKLINSEIDGLLNAANCSTVIIQKSFEHKINPQNFQLIIFPELKSENTNFVAREELYLDDHAVIIFTSGSTDNSKGIILSFRSLYNSTINGNNLLRYTISDRWLASLPFYHIGGFSIIARAILFGIPIIIPDSNSIQDLNSAIKNWQPTFVSIVSAQLKKFVDEELTPNPELKNCLVGGGFIDKELLLKAYDLGWPVNVVYGSTETSSFVTALLKDEIIFKPNSVGRAVPTNRILITDVNGNELKPFEIGQITIQSNALMSGYLNKNESPQLVENELHQTDDLGYVDEEGYLFIEGRKNYLISSGGENVNPFEIEKTLLEHHLIQEAAVFPLKDIVWGEIIAASLVIINKEVKPTLEEIKLFLKDKLPDFKIPKKIFFTEELPKTELGKIQKDKLIERYKLTSL